MTVKLTLSQLEQYLFKAAWILKGPVDASDFKAYSRIDQPVDKYKHA